MAEKRKKGYKVYAEKKKVFIYPDATNEEKEVVAHYESVLGYTIFLGKRQAKEETVDTAEKIDLKNINAENAWEAYNKITKQEMYDYIVANKPEEDLKAFAVASHKPVKKLDKEGKEVEKKVKTKKNTDIPMYYNISAKRYFFETYFKELWDNQIKNKLNAKNKKTDNIDKMEQELLKRLK
jgi:hypothetical protein